MSFIDVKEMFVSIQGESSFAGMGCFFVRLSGCNLRCGYCDTVGALAASGNLVAVADVVRDVGRSVVPLVEITGGEPLLQAGFRELALGLVSLPGKQLLVETNGSQDIGVIPDDAVAVVDVKCPGSGEGDSFDLANLERFRPHDEVKFVLSGREDYEFARDFLDKQGLISRVRYVHFSPVAGVLDAGELGRWIVEDGLRVRLQVQLHRVVGLS